jgi:diaminohydroxyphosphoribosylaminopyrimidine deaminase/5-amino-6-(5-phosphoribosylamino)uracil reductase
MQRALALAARGLGRTHPNPAVGAVVVQRGRVVGEGFHRRAGEPHAEAIALARAGGRTRGATLYVTLEPCVHHGRTPPCVDATLAAGIARVVVGMVDPDPRVRGRGIRRLRGGGVRVTTGVRAADCRRLLRGYVMRTLRGRPFLVLKLAASLDGRIATAAGMSRWITGRAARRHAHVLRDRLDAVMVGAGTVRSDDPRLTCRLRGGRDPIRVVVDGRLRVSARARVLRVRSAAPTWVLCAADAPRVREELLRAAGADVIRMPGRRRVRLRAALAELGRRGVTSVLLEGGATLAAAALRERVVDSVLLMLAPMIIGGDGVPMVGALQVRSLDRAPRLGGLRIEPIGGDLLLEATLSLPSAAL